MAFLHKGKLVLCEEKDTLIQIWIVHATRSESGVVPKNAIVSKRRLHMGLMLLCLGETPKTVKIENLRLRTYLYLCTNTGRRITSERVAFKRFLYFD